MKQVLQSARSGELSVTDVPTPTLRPQGVLVRTAASLVSAGTERSVVDFASKNLLEKARSRPDLVRQTLDRAQREGVIGTIEAVRNRLDQPIALGYSSAGVVVEVGAEAGPFHTGDRVACAGAGYAVHAEVAYVPRTLAVKLPDVVSFDEAAFTTVGAIAMQGVRQAEVTLGGRVAVIGLGLLGQLTVQLLKAAGCQVFGTDPNAQRAELARALGADTTVGSDGVAEAARAFTQERGFDAVIITAATGSNEPVRLAGEFCRDRGIVVAVGAVGLEIPRKPYYEKELDFRLSRSYGPGRYDPAYEDKGQDYPYGYVRWTEQRNMEAFVQLVAAGQVKLAPLITHRFAIEQASAAYDLITGKSGEPFLGVVLTYSADTPLPRRIAVAPAAAAHHAPQASVRLGMIGAGSFVNGVLLPAMKDIPGLDLCGIVSGSGMTARAAADRFGFHYCASDPDQLLDDAGINWIAVTTRHNLHAAQSIAAMRAGKDVFVEKPAALSLDQLMRVAQTQRQTGRRLLVGFNRRFAPMVQEMRRFLRPGNRPLVATYRVNAGFIDRSHWTQDPAVGGGRLIGEACHFVDLLQYLIGAAPVQVYARAAQTEQGAIEDEVIALFTFADGSIGSVIYAAGGDRRYGKERIEVFGGARVAVLDDFRSLELVRGGKRSRRVERFRPDKGHRAEWEAIVAASRDASASPIPPQEIIAAHLATFALLESLREGRPVIVDVEAFEESVQRH